MSSHPPLLVLAFFVTVVPVPASADVIFTDTTFNPGNYNNFSATPNLDPGVTASYAQCQSCGNPGQGFKAVVSIPLTGGGAFVGFLNNTFVYDAQTEGAIDSLSTSVDKDLTLNRPTTNFASFFYPLIWQGGNFYVASIAGGTIDSGTTTGYETIGQTGMMATDFGLYDFGTTSFPDFSQNPDFSAAGAQMTFGWAPLISANDAFNITVDYDNLNFDIIQSGTPPPAPVPESSSAVLVSIFLGGVALGTVKPALLSKLKL